MPQRATIFDATQRRAALDAYRIAEDLTGDFFALPALDAHRHPVELRTLAELDAHEVVPEGVFAQVARYDERAGLASAARTLYRVCLQDHAILDRLLAERGRVGLFPLLVYVLTHELVHVARFLRHQSPFLVGPEVRAQEERRVHEITHRILGGVRLPELDNVLARWRG